MLSLTDAQMNAWLAQFIWPFARILALLGTAPLFGESTIPRQAKVGLAFVLTVAISPTLNIPIDIPVSSYTGLMILTQQVLIGIAMGFTMRLVFAAVQTAGEFVGLQMGLSFATFFDPVSGAQTAVLSRIFNILAVLVFVAVDGHLLVLGTLVQSFDLLPAAPLRLSVDGWGVIIERGSQVFVSGLLLALPLIAALLSINLALGILNRAAPQLSVFSVGFPITLTVGLILLAIVLPNMLPFMETLFRGGLEAMTRVVQALAGDAQL